MTGDDQRRGTCARLSIDVGSGVDEQTQHVHVTVQCGRHQRRLTVLGRQSVDLYVNSLAVRPPRMRQNYFRAASAVFTSSHMKHRA